MKKLIAFLPALFILSALLPVNPRPAQAAPLGLTETVSAAYDTTISDSNPDENLGEETIFFIGEVTDGNYQGKGLLTFDLSGVPSNAIISAVTLTITQVSEASDYSTTIHVHRVKRNWTESGATWNKYDGTNSWQTTGALGENDVDYLAIGTREFAADEADGPKSFSLDTSTIQDMIGGTYQNYGFYFQTVSTTDTAYIFASSEYETEADRPLLEIEYEVPTVTPTPTVTATSAPASEYCASTVDASLDYYSLTIPEPPPVSHCYQDEIVLHAEENEGYGGGFISFVFDTAPHTGVESYDASVYLEINNIEDVISIVCSTNHGFITLIVLEEISAPFGAMINIPSACIYPEQPIAIGFINETASTAGHTIDIDQVMLAQGESITPTPTPATTPQPGNVSTTITYGDVAIFAAINFLSAITGLGLVYLIVSSIIFRKRN